MKYLDEFRDSGIARRLADDIARTTTRPWTVMEVCGGQTHAILRFGLDRLLPSAVTLLHGPGCPVCVTPIEIIDRAQRLAIQPEVTFCSFGDMLRVPGSRTNLLASRAAGADVRVVYSPLDAVKLAAAHPQRQVVFFAVGFETTAPATALAVRHAAALGLENFSLLTAHVLVPPALESILAAPDCRVQGFLAAGHVCSVMGQREYEPIAARHRVPIVVTGFEPLDILEGVRLLVRQLEEGRAEVENAYRRVVRPDGNRSAIELVNEVFQVIPRQWRGVGTIPSSGLGLREAYAQFDAEKRFPLPDTVPVEAIDCRSGDVLQGRIRPTDCPHFGTRCTPEQPLGATMVSSEGACAAYFRYREQPA